MISLDITHPDAEEFIDAKLKEGKITGANISVRITDEFMDCLNNDKIFIQKFPIDLDISKHTPFDELLFNKEFDYDKLYPLELSDGEYKGCYAKVKSAKKLWDKIMYNS